MTERIAVICRDRNGFWRPEHSFDKDDVCVFCDCERQNARVTPADVHEVGWIPAPPPGAVRYQIEKLTRVKSTPRHGQF